MSDKKETSGMGAVLTILGAGAGLMWGGPVGCAIGAGLGALAGRQAEREHRGTSLGGSSSTPCRSSAGTGGGGGHFAPSIPRYRVGLEPVTPAVEPLAEAQSRFLARIPDPAPFRLPEPFADAGIFARVGALYEDEPVPSLCRLPREPIIPALRTTPTPEPPSLRFEPRIPELLPLERLGPPPALSSPLPEPRLPTRMDNIVAGVDPAYAPIYTEAGLVGIVPRKY